MRGSRSAVFDVESRVVQEFLDEYQHLLKQDRVVFDLKKCSTLPILGGGSNSGYASKARSTASDSKGKSRDGKRGSDRELFVGGLSYSVTQDDLRDFFEGKGFRIEKLKLLTDRETGKSKGAAFVELDTEREASKAVGDLNGASLMDRRLKVSLSSDRR